MWEEENDTDKRQEVQEAAPSMLLLQKKKTSYPTPEKVQEVQAMKARKAKLAELAQERQLKLTSSSDSAKPNKKLCLTKTVVAKKKELIRTREKLGMFHINQGHSFYPHMCWRCGCCTFCNDESEEYCLFCVTST